MGLAIHTSPGAEPSAKARALIDRREELMREIRSIRDSSDVASETESIAKLCEIERELLKELESDPNCPAAQIDFLRDQHMGVLKAVADREEKTDLEGCRAVWVELVEQATKLNDADHWTTRTARSELERIERQMELSVEERAELGRAAELHERSTTERKAGRYREALESAKQAYGIRKRLLGRNQPRTAATLNNLWLVRYEG